MLNFVNITNFLNLHFRKVVGFFIVFYVVGIVGMLLPVTFPLFVKLIPLALLLSFVALVFFHSIYNLKTLIIFILIYLLGFFVEVAGVNTGVIFGDYLYGESLGLKAFNTPLIIGINWLLLVYITASVLENTNLNTVLKVIIAAAMMLAYDIIIEQIAPRLGMWQWQNEVVPLKNYIAWFLIAFIFHTIIQVFGVKTKNKLAPAILTCQVLFFLILLITFKMAH